MLSLHSHSGQFCCHAKGTLEEVVKSAIAQGFEVYGLTEHIPRLRREDFYPEEEHMGVEDMEAMFDAFVAEAQRLQIIYGDRIHLLIGAESEFIYPEQAKEVLRLRSLYGLDYIVGSVHHVQGGIPIDFDVAEYERALAACDGSLEHLFCTYFDAQFEMLSALKPEVVAHFDLVRIFRPEIIAMPSASVWHRVCRNVDFIISYGGLFELNSRAWKKGLRDAYPQRDIVQYICKQGGLFTLSDDCHGPGDVGMFYDRLLAYVCEMGISEVYALKKMDGRVSKVPISTVSLNSWMQKDGQSS